MLIPCGNAICIIATVLNISADIYYGIAFTQEFIFKFVKIFTESC